jgi:AcrR family transcriptional regulator
VNRYVYIMANRAYRLGRRARGKQETRERIVRATAELHAEVGPAATTISAVAERAGVQRLTVYRHFPDAAGLFAACAEHSLGEYPPPDPGLWRECVEPAERAERALVALYEYYEGGAELFAQVFRDAEQLPALDDALGPVRHYLETAAADLAEGWGPAADESRAFHAFLDHALDFWTWRSLAGKGLPTSEAARLMAGLLTTLAESPP